VSGPMANGPYTAAPGGNFNIPHFASTNQPHLEEEEDQIGDMPSQNLYSMGANRPMTAAMDGARFSQQQTKMNANSPPFVPGLSSTVQTPSSQAQAHAMQEMQMLQMEVMRLQVSSIITQISTPGVDSPSNSLSRLNNTRRVYRQTTLQSLCVSRWRKARRAGAPVTAPLLPVL
jgi:hypothetical protein